MNIRLDDAVNWDAIKKYDTRMGYALSGWARWRSDYGPGPPIVTWRDLRDVPVNELARIPNFGRKSLQKLQAFLADRGLVLKDSCQIQAEISFTGSVARQIDAITERLEKRSLHFQPDDDPELFHEVGQLLLRAASMLRELL